MLSIWVFLINSINPVGAFDSKNQHNNPRATCSAWAGPKKLFVCRHLTDPIPEVLTQNILLDF